MDVTLVSALLTSLTAAIGYLARELVTAERRRADNHEARANRLQEILDTRAKEAEDKTRAAEMENTKLRLELEMLKQKMGQ